MIFYLHPLPRKRLQQPSPPSSLLWNILNKEGSITYSKYLKITFILGVKKSFFAIFLKSYAAFLIICTISYQLRFDQLKEQIYINLQLRDFFDLWHLLILHSVEVFISFVLPTIEIENISIEFLSFFYSLELCIFITEFPQNR